MTYILFIIYYFPEQVNGNNHDSSTTTSSSEPTPPDNLAPPTHQRLAASASAPLQDSNLSGGHSLKTDLYTTKSNLQQGSSSNTASPTKCILNNHKMEERRRYKIYYQYRESVQRITIRRQNPKLES